jgi:Trp operon repressor
LTKDTEIVDLLDQAMKGKQGQRNDLVDNIQEVRAPTGTSKDAGLRRAIKAKELRQQGMTQREIAEELGVDQATVSRDVCRNNGMPQKLHTTKRERTVIQLSPGTDPAAAATRIRARRLRRDDDGDQEVGAQVR